MTAALEGGEWSAARPGRTLPPGKTWYPLYRRLGGPQSRSGRAEILVLTRIQSWTIQPVVSRYTDWATRPTLQYVFWWNTIWTLCHFLQSASTTWWKHSLVRWEQQTITTEVSNCKRSNRCSRCKKCTYSNPVLWHGGDSTVWILHVFSYDYYIMENKNEQWFDPFYCSFSKSAGVCSYPNHHKEVNYSAENVTSFTLRVCVSASPSFTALGVNSGESCSMASSMKGSGFKSLSQDQLSCFL